MGPSVALKEGGALKAVTFNVCRIRMEKRLRTNSWFRNKIML